jgi:hypothetical protein
MLIAPVLGRPVDDDHLLLLAGLDLDAADPPPQASTSTSPKTTGLQGKNYGPGRTDQAAKPADFSVVSHNFSTGPAGRC